MADRTHAPDYTVANTPHCLIHCGPTGSDQTDDNRDLTINTSANCQLLYHKSGGKTELIQGTSTEVCGYNIDPKQKDAVARAIVADNGDIILIADNGNIRMRAKNIYMETSAGESGQGNFMVQANGQVMLSTGDEIRLAAGNMCFTASKAFQFVGDFKQVGKFVSGGAADAAGAVSSLLTGNWSAILSTISRTCK